MEKEQLRLKRSEKIQLIWSFLKGAKLLFMVGVLMTGLTALCDMLIPQIIRATVDYAIGGQTPEYPEWIMNAINAIGGFSKLGQNLWMLSLSVLGVSGVKIISEYLSRLCDTLGSETLVKTMRDRLFTHIQRLPFTWHMQNKTGDIIQRCTSDIETTRSFVSDQLVSIFRIVLLAVLSIFFMVRMDVRMTLIAIIPMGFILWYSWKFHVDVGIGFEKCDENEGILSAMAQENLTGVRVVRAFGQEQKERDKFKKHNEYYTSLWVHMAKLMGRFWSFSDLFAGLQMMLVVVVGAVFCVNDLLTPGAYIAFISYNGMLMWPIRMLGRMLSELSKADVSVDRIGYILKAEVEKDAPNAVEVPMNQDIRFSHVSYSFDESSEVLHDIDFSIKAGTTVGILGGTGSGKSTLMMLLDRLYDLPEGSGDIFIGDVNLRDIKRECVRRNIGIVLQEPFLFSRTLYENIGITNEEITREEIEEATNTACLDETISKFTKGYDTFVGERGVTLSGGQKQRAAIARMLTQKTPIMIFDDSLSAVDTETDAKIRKSLEQKFGTATIILISHRITTLSKADQVIVLEHGQIVQKGTPKELENTDGIYRKICEIQSGTREEVRA